VMDSKQMKTVMHFEYDPEGDPLGIGSYGKVFKGIDTKSKEPVAIKVINKDKFQNDTIVLDCLMKEINVLRGIKAPSIMQFIEAFKTVNNFYIITEYCEGGSLEELMQKEGPKLTETKALDIVKQIAEAFCAIQQLKLYNDKGEELLLMHRDIKPANILFKNGKVKLADFGFSVFVNKLQEKPERIQMGTPCYMSPQILTRKSYGAKTDIWSTGMVLCELLFACFPWQAETPYKLGEKIINEPLTFPVDRIIGEKTKSLLRGMLTVSEEGRITWDQILAHPVFKPRISLMQS